MKTRFSPLFGLACSITMFCLTGCGGQDQPSSMTEGVDLSEIEAYEQSVREMESEDANALDDVSE